MNRCVYTFLLYLALPFTPLKLFWRARKQPEYLQHWRERYGFYHVQLTQPVIWLHCVSVGETRAAAPLIKALLAQYPKHQILLSHATPTGRATSEQLFGNSVCRVYLPFDVPFAVARFLKHFKPALGVLMETELWFNLIAACQQKNIPLLLVNARLSEKSAHGYAKLGGLVREGLQSLSAVAAQTTQDAARLQALGANNVTVAGNLKFDVSPPAGALAAGEYLRSLLGKNRPILLAASTREGEEALILDALATLAIPNLLVIIVPRHPQRFNAVADLLQQRNFRYAKKSSLTQPVDAATQVLLGDSMGELFTYYAACDVAIIGGSLLPFGGQNLIEAMCMHKPVLIGAHTFNFKEVTELAVAQGAARQINSVTELSLTVKELIASPQQQTVMGSAGAALCQASQGATTAITALIAQYH